MAINTQTQGNIGTELVNQLYLGTDLEKQETQPIFILHRDTIRSFLHEKSSLMGLEARLLGLAGVEITLLATLSTVTFNNAFGIPAGGIQGTFVAFSLLFGYFIIREGIQWFKYKDSLTIDKLTEDLGKRGAVLKESVRNSNDISANKAN